VTVGFRVVLVVAAMLGVVRLTSALGPVHDERDGVAALRGGDGRPRPQQVARAYRLLERSAAHTRSTEPDVRLSQLDAFTGRPDRAVRRLKGVVGREPANLEAQILLAQIARSVDPRLAEHARRRVLALSPPVR